MESLVVCRPQTGHWSEPFAYCRAICRTTSKSTVHENRYIGTRHFCFSSLGRPRKTPSVPIEESLFIMKGEAGRSCTETCASNHSFCHSDGILKLNTCDELRSVFLCEAGCEIAKHSEIGKGLEFPGYVVDGSDKQEFPAQCFVGSHGKGKGHICDASAKHVERLCVCTNAQTKKADNEDSAAADIENAMKSMERKVLLDS